MGAAESHATERVGRYEGAGRLATGGMAEILLGRLVGPSGFERPLVIKRILPHLAEQQSFVSMFLDEARLAAQIRHPNVVSVSELGQEGDDLYLVMEYLEGENAAGLIRRSMVTGKNTDFALCAYIVAEACAGLHAAHELTDPDGNPLRLVHRDVSPQNIFVTYGGAVKVLDFGIAKAADRITQTEAGQLKGKFDYMSPEQCRGRALDRRSDVFALGIVLYELTTRKRLFKRSNKLAMLEAVCRDPIYPPSKLIKGYPAALERVLMKALKRDPDARYATAAEMRRDLLSAMREMNAPVAPEEALASLMTEIFSDRITSKRDMLARLRMGSSITEVPAAEVDSGVEIPEVEHDSDSLMSGVRGKAESNISSIMPMSSDAEDLQRRRRRRLIGVAVGLTGLLAAAAVVLTQRSEPPPHHLQALGALPGLSSAAHRARVEKVTLSVDSTPMGAHVMVGDVDQGQTPLELRLPKGKAELRISLTLEGYAPAAENITPDVNQRIKVLLSKKEEEQKQPSRVYVSQPKEKGSSSFHRFD